MLNIYLKCAVLNIDNQTTFYQFQLFFEKNNYVEPIEFGRFEIYSEDNIKIYFDQEISI